ncbi:MAG: tyrosine-type recombinase/integrase [Candidatus Methylomirabilis oxyfera]|nr:tyrosine-type recombinase/integrase [Candidatus Methylomirabilis oxyfera]
MGARVKKRGLSWTVYSSFEGKRKARACKTRDEAERIAKEIRLTQLRGSFGLSAPEQQHVTTFQQAAEEWLERYVRRNCERSTQEGYARMLHQQVFPIFGHTPTHEVSRRDIEALANRMSDGGLSKGTIKICLAVISGIYNDLIEHGEAVTNPAARPGKILRDKVDKRLARVPLTPDEVRRLLDAARALDQERAGRHGTEVSRYLLLLTLLLTGLRVGELMGLQWRDLDLSSGVLEVRRQRTRGQNSPPKNHRMKREDLARPLWEALKAAMENRRAELAYQGRDLDLEENIFRNRVGRPFDAPSVRRLLHASVARAGLRHMTPHLMRHTFCGQALTTGAPAAYVKEMAGHASIQLTVDTYGHLTPGANRGAMDRLAESWGVGSATITTATPSG